MLQPTVMMTRLPESSSGWVPVPNFLIDRVMPRLSDTAWRVLCVIVRQTFGWNIGPDGRKRQDWISSSQFRRRPGRHSSAISRAIDLLVRSHLVRVQDRDGALLKTSAERRRSRSRLFFSLTPVLMLINSHLDDRGPFERISKSANNKTNPNKRKTTTDNGNSRS